MSAVEKLGLMGKMGIMKKAQDFFHRFRYSHISYLSHNSHLSHLPAKTFWLSLPAAFALYAVVFHCSGIFFWGGLGITSLALCLGGWLTNGQTLRQQLRFAGWGWTLGGGILGAAALYLIFLIGGYCSTLILPHGADSIHSIYDRGAGVSHLVILAILIIVASAEEVYWRGCLQPMLTDRFGWFIGWVATSALYAGVHIAAGNFVLFGAAGVAGLAFGLAAFLRSGLWGVILMHLLFDVTAFQIAPMRF